MRAGAVAALMEDETNLMVPVTFKDMTIRTLTIRVIEDKRKQFTIFKEKFTFFPSTSERNFSFAFLKFERQILYPYYQAKSPFCV